MDSDHAYLRHNPLLTRLWLRQHLSRIPRYTSGQHPNHRDRLPGGASLSTGLGHLRDQITAQDHTSAIERLHHHLAGSRCQNEIEDRDTMDRRQGRGKDHLFRLRYLLCRAVRRGLRCHLHLRRSHQLQCKGTSWTDREWPSHLRGSSGTSHLLGLSMVSSAESERCVLTYQAQHSDLTISCISLGRSRGMVLECPCHRPQLARRTQSVCA